MSNAWEISINGLSSPKGFEIYEDAESSPRRGKSPSQDSQSIEHNHENTNYINYLQSNQTLTRIHIGVMFNQLDSGNGQQNIQVQAPIECPTSIQIFLQSYSKWSYILEKIKELKDITVKGSLMDGQENQEGCLQLHLIKVSQILDEWVLIIVCPNGLVSSLLVIMKLIIELYDDVSLVIPRIKSYQLESLKEVSKSEFIKSTSNSFNIFIRGKIFNLKSNGNAKRAAKFIMTYLTTGAHLENLDPLFSNHSLGKFSTPPTLQYLYDNENISSATANLKAVILEQKRIRNKEKPVTKVLTFLRSEVTILIGKKGKGIQKIRSQTTATISIETIDVEKEKKIDKQQTHNGISIPSLQDVSITGQRDEVEEAASLVNSYVKLQRILKWDL